MSTAINLLFVAYGIYTLNHRECMFKFVLIHYILRMVNHTFPVYSMEIASLMGISVYISDFFILLLITIMLLQSRGNGLVTARREFPFYIFVLIALLSMVLGVMQYGLVTDWFNETRKFLYMVVPIIYFASNPVDIGYENKRTLQIVMRSILIYCVICWVSALVFGVYLTSNGTLRCLGSDYAFILSIYTIYLAYNDLVLSTEKSIRLETILFILAIILLQHNTVYASLGVSLAFIIILRFGKVFLERPKWIVQAVIIIIIIAAFLNTSIGARIKEPILSTFDKFNEFSESVSGEETGSIGTRMSLWSSLIATLNSPFDWLFGKNFGTGYHVTWRGSEWTASAHSGYIETLMRVGLVGCVCLIGSVVRNIVQHIREKDILCASILVSILVYWYSYSYTAEIGFLIGMSFALLNGNVWFEEWDKAEDDVQETTMKGR
ncbi:MAG: O-antigen ligase family protein [Lachnospiraceae bacterium]|nr:O-antigen ligase family protein [Lachnospiraceae bacterium]